MRTAAAICALAFAGIVVSARAGAPAEDRIDAAFAKFWAAGRSQDAEKAVADVVTSGVAFDDAFARLRRGRSYSSGVARGSTRQTRRTAVGNFFYNVEVPESYEWPVLPVGSIFPT